MKTTDLDKKSFIEGFKEGCEFGKKCYSPKQGEWIWLGDNPNPNHKFSCNRCGRAVKEQENFCPNCGLKMLKGDAI